MAQIIKEISLEVSKPNLIQAIVAKQYDNNSRFLKVTLMHENQKIEISPTSTVTINAKRNDGTEKPFAGEANNDGTATVPLTYWMLELEGTVYCDVSVIDTDGRRLSSTKFELLVERASCSSDDITEDENYDVLINLIAEVNKVTPDQTYDPTSENAQSGVAVAEATKEVTDFTNNTYANAIKGSVSGIAISVNDASPVEHTLDVQVYSNGKNLVNIANFQLEKSLYGSGAGGTVTLVDNSARASILHIKTEPNTTYTFSLDNTTYWLNRLCEMNANDICTKNHAFYNTNVDYNSFTWTTLSTTEYIALQVTNKNGDTVTLKDLQEINLQIEQGDVATEYEEYPDLTSVTVTRYGTNETDNLMAYTPNADGTVDGVLSLSTDMTLLTDSEDVSIECTYNRDTQKVVSEINDNIEGVKSELDKKVTAYTPVTLLSATLTEEVGSVEITAYNDLPFYCNKFTVRMDIPCTETASYIEVYGMRMGGSYQQLNNQLSDMQTVVEGSNTTHTLAVVNADFNGNVFCDITFGGLKAAANSTWNTVYPKLVSYLKSIVASSYNEKGTQGIKIKLASGNLPVGTIIDVWGCISQ